MTEAHPTTLEGRAERFAHRLVVALVNLEMRASDHVAEDIERMLDDLRVLARACEPAAALEPPGRPTPAAVPATIDRSAVL